jgi:hypothetical protein
MNRDQRYKYEMFVRVRDFGTTNRERFPESSTGGVMFGQVTAAVAAIDEHLKQRILGRVEGRGVKPLTRAAAFDYMKAIAKAARRVTRDERVVNPFRMPPRRTLKVEIATARVFIEEAATRQDAFIRLGLPPTFISDFTALVNELQSAVDTRLSSKTARGQAQAGIAAALAQGLEVIRDLEVVVEMATRDDPALAAAWHTARHIEGQGTSATTPAKEPVPVVEAPVVTPATPVVTAESVPPAGAERAATVPTSEEVLRRAS